MRRAVRFFNACPWLLLAAGQPLFSAGTQERVDFARDVRPILQKHCLDCHGAGKQRGGLRLDARAAALKGGDEHGPPIVMGKSGESLLIRLVSGADKDLRMPPKGDGLNEMEIDLLKRWIDQGAAWPEDGITAPDPTKTHWAFQPVAGTQEKDGPGAGKPPTAPSVDSFIQTKLKEAGLRMSPEANRRTLIRRVSFDLVGLPPTPEEVAHFVQDPDPLAYEKLVERLLSSPHHGERWARHWLDVVRFAESDGFEKNSERRDAWPYRDYVIQAFNDDKPYDQFIREQLAGDASGADAATGFLVGGPNDTVRSPDPVLTAQQRADELNDMVATTGSAFLGLTLGCARCHTHKFDPVTHHDYHAIMAMFAGVKHGSRPMTPSDQKARETRATELRKELLPIEEELRRFEPLATTRRTLVIAPGDPVRVVKYQASSKGRTRYETGKARGEAQFSGDGVEPPTLADGYWVWLGDHARGDVMAWKPGLQGRFRIWVSWGSGYASHDEDARYVLDADGNPATTHDQKEVAQADQRKFADRTGKMPNRKLWSGFKDIGVHELHEQAGLILRVGGSKGFPTADLIVFQEEPAARTSAGRPQLRLPVKAGANVEHFAPVEAKFVRFTIEASTGGQPCLDELEVFTSGPEPRNVALAALGAKATASSVLPGHAIHQIAHLNDGLYGNEHSWISNENGRGWVQIELPAAAQVDRVTWSRDRGDSPRYQDRLPLDYRVETSGDGISWTVVAGSRDRLPHGLDLAVTSLPSANGLPDGESRRFNDLQKERKRLEAAWTDATTPPMVYAGRFTLPDPTRRFQRGDVTQPREIIAPGVVAALHPVPSLPLDATDQARRLALAAWITSPENPLTARVMANRVWHYHFGTGIVDTPSDLGVNGGRPTHPELLDWLAADFMANGWSLKRLHRLMVLSATYRQASYPAEGASPATAAQFASGLAKDAQTRLLWRFPPRRLEAEALRDTLLAVSGSLDLRMGGPGFDLFEPNTNYVKIYYSKSEFGPGDFRRMVYQSKPRVQLDNIFGAFDCPDAGQIAPRRNVSTTPLQALGLLHSSFALQQAGFFATRLEREAGAVPGSQVKRAFQLAFNRNPGPEEQEAALALVREHGLAALCRALINSNEFIQIF